jgi:hypothetical protein
METQADPLLFYQNISTFKKGERCGIPVKDGILKSFGDLEDRDSRPFSGIDIADQPTLRIEVRGRAFVGTSALITDDPQQWSGYPSWGATVG